MGEGLRGRRGLAGLVEFEEGRLFTDESRLPGARMPDAQRAVVELAAKS